MARNVLEVVIDGPRNQSLFFKPLSRRIRGRMDLRRHPTVHGRMKADEWPEGGVPGQRLGVNLDSSEAYLVDDIHASLAVKDKIAESGRKLPPEREDFGKVDLSTWLYWLSRAVEAGIARVVKGTFPASLPGKPQTKFATNRVDISPQDRFAAFVQSQN